MSCLGLFLALSMHVGLDANYNSVHPHARCTVDNSITGVYYNSEDRVSAQIGKEFELAKGHIELGLVSGYKATEVLPMIRYKQGNFFISPAYEKHNGEENIGFVIGLEFGR